MLSRHHTILALLLFLYSGAGWAQENRCATVEYSELKRQVSSQRLEEQAMYAAVRDHVNRWKGNPGQNAITTVTVIPVVIHVVYNTAAQNISRNQILSQIDVLNQDFAKLNADTALWIPSVWNSLAVNSQIQFCLATRKPNGDWTDGIERRLTSKTSYTTGNIDSAKYSAFGGLDAWDYTQYLNIWVVNFANGVLGVTQMPLTGPASTDGLCIQYNAFGKGPYPLLTNYNKGRTATHEVGHWLGLFHIWGDDNGDCDGTDYISDTPNQTSEHFNCPVFPSLDTCSPVSPGTMYMNFMDYSYDRCLVMYTQEQAMAMNAQFTGFRSGLVTSQGCMPPIGVDEHDLDRMVTVYPNPADHSFSVRVDLPFSAKVSLTLHDALGRMVYAAGSEPDGRWQIPVSEFAGGIYILRIQIDGKEIHKKICIRHS